ncbi:hypothetical protein KCV01_g2192, partial [Aureobasidium melanogenum]
MHDLKPRRSIGPETARRIALGDAFEEMVAVAYEGEGHVVDRHGRARRGAKGDGGVDLFVQLSHSSPGQRLAIQCKARRQGEIGVDQVQRMVGIVTSEERVDRGVVVTTARFSDAAWRLAHAQGIELIDGDGLKNRWNMDGQALHDRFPPILSDPPSAAPVSSAPHVPVVSAPLAARKHRVLLAALLLVAVFGLGYAVHRLTGAPAKADAVASVAPTSLPDAAAPPLHQIAAKPSPPPAARRAPATPSATAKRLVERRASPVPVREEPLAEPIYKSANMSDEEFAAWKRRKAERERSPQEGRDAPPPADPAYIDARDPGVSSETMRAILRSNRH